MSRLIMSVITIAGVACAGAAFAGPHLTKELYMAELQRAEAQRKVEKLACDSRAGNAKDICLAEARATETVAKADAEASYKNTPKARENARLARAKAMFEVAKERCDDLAGTPKEVCVKEAKAGMVKEQGNAKVDRAVIEANRDAAEHKAEARDEAAENRVNADYKVAIEKCESMAGPTKDSCVRDAKKHFNK